MKILDAIRQAIDQCGKTLYRISRETGFSESQLGKLMRGQIGLSIERLEALADYLDLEIIIRPRRKGKTDGKHQSR
jgi:transcriptional regulator with XRE-family HTH domain